MEQTLRERFLELRRNSQNLTSNPLLNCFDLNELLTIDNASTIDTFIKEKKENILSLSKNIIVDFDSKLKGAFDEYSEALIYLLLKSKFQAISRVPEKKNEKTPDFSIPLDIAIANKSEKLTVYVEVKALAFANGNNNYREAMSQATAAQIDMERQLKLGKKVAFGEYVISPLMKAGSSTIRDEIAIIIDKIDQNIKPEQYNKGDTILFVDMKQLGTQSNPEDMALPVFRERRLYSYVSGLLWNVAFGRHTDRVYIPIEFEGKENIGEDLGRDGILTQHSFIKAICFKVHSLAGEPKIVGMKRYREEKDAVTIFLNKVCDYINDDMNSHYWELLPDDLQSTK